MYHLYWQFCCNDQGCRICRKNEKFPPTGKFVQEFRYTWYSLETSPNAIIFKKTASDATVFQKFPQIRKFPPNARWRTRVDSAPLWRRMKTMNSSPSNMNFLAKEIHNYFATRKILLRDIDMFSWNHFSLPFHSLIFADRPIFLLNLSADGRWLTARMNQSNWDKIRKYFSYYYE